MQATRRQFNRGVSLVEALVAMAVMAIGMLGIVGLQATLRGNSDIAKQRSEAVRYAQEAIEQWRSVTAMDATPNRMAYAQLTTQGAETIAGINATFTRTRTIAEMDTRDGIPEIDRLPRAKSLRVTVGWNDRTGQPQSVSLSTAISGVMPELAASLAVPIDGDPVRVPQGRNRGIPPLARSLGDGTSAMKQPGETSTVAWRFDDVTGLLTRCVTSAATTAELTTENVCLTVIDTARLLAGYVRYATTATPPSELDARRPPSAPIADLTTVTVVRSDGGGAPNCLPTVRSEGAGGYLSYYCTVPVTVTAEDPTPYWSGSVVLGFATTQIASTSSESADTKVKVCAYPNPRLALGFAKFTGGGSSLVLGPGALFRSWAADDRISVARDNWTYANRVSSAVSVPAPGVTTQTIPVRQALPGTGTGIDGLVYNDWYSDSAMLPGYRSVAVNLINHNYLVIRAGDSPVGSTSFNCPPSTILHQPAPSAS